MKSRLWVAPGLIQVVPEILDFGLVNQGPGLEQLVTVTNIGRCP